jgi:hypothetical protein
MSDETIRVSNEGGGGTTGAFSELVRLQTEFQARLAEETLGYLRRLQGAAAPATPGTVLIPRDGAALQAGGSPGSSVDLSLELDNRQRVHCLVTPMLGPLVSSEGVTWFPQAEGGTETTLVPPGQAQSRALRVTIPLGLPPGVYRGALILQGFAGQGVPVSIDVAAPAAARPPRRRAATKPARTK